MIDGDNEEPNFDVTPETIAGVTGLPVHDSAKIMAELIPEEINCVDEGYLRGGAEYAGDRLKFLLRDVRL